jgi:TonB family protein
MCMTAFARSAPAKEPDILKPSARADPQLKPGDESQAIEVKAEAAVEPVAAEAAPAPAPAAAPVTEAPSEQTTPAAETNAGAETTPAAEAATTSAPAKAPSEDPEGITLNADERIRAAVKQNERTLWLSAAGVTLLYIAAFAISVMRLSPAEIAEMMKKRRGQDAPDSISVELVPDPDAKSKTTKWQEGTETTQQAETPPQPPQQRQVASLEQPKVDESKEEPKPEDAPAAEEKPKPEDAPVAEQQHEFSPALPDINTLVDAAAADLDRKIKEHLEQQKQRQQRQQEARQAQAPGGPLQIRGTGASGRSDPFSRSVIAALLKTRPGPFALWGRVLVSFQISESGQVAYVHLLQSSGNSAMDQAAINAIRRAQFQRPPPGMSPDDRTYIIDYIFG